MSLTWPWALFGLLAIPLLVRRLPAAAPAAGASAGRELARQGLVAHRRAATGCGTSRRPCSSPPSRCSSSRCPARWRRSRSRAARARSCSPSTCRAAWPPTDMQPTPARRGQGGRKGLRREAAVDACASASSPSAARRSSPQQPTDDRAAVLAAINRLTPQGDTSLGGGILTSLSAIAGKPIVSDGDAETGQRGRDPASATTAARRSSCSPTARTRADPTPPISPTWRPRPACGSRRSGSAAPKGTVLEIDGFSIATAPRRGHPASRSRRPTGRHLPRGDRRRLARAGLRLDPAQLGDADACPTRSPPSSRLSRRCCCSPARPSPCCARAGDLSVLRPAPAAPGAAGRADPARRIPLAAAPAAAAGGAALERRARPCRGRPGAALAAARADRRSCSPASPCSGWQPHARRCGPTCRSRARRCILALDVSGSMCATDVDPNRLGAAQAAVRDVHRGAATTRPRSASSCSPASRSSRCAPTTERDDLLTAARRRDDRPWDDDRCGHPHLDRRHRRARPRTWRRATPSTDPATTAPGAPRSPDAVAEPDAGDSGAPRCEPSATSRPRSSCCSPTAPTRAASRREDAADQAAARGVRVYPIGFGTRTPRRWPARATRSAASSRRGSAAASAGRWWRRWRWSQLPRRRRAGPADRRRTTGGVYFGATDAAQLDDACWPTCRSTSPPSSGRRPQCRLRRSGGAGPPARASACRSAGHAHLM